MLVATKPMNEGDHTISEPPKQKTLLENFLDFFTFSKQEQQKVQSNPQIVSDESVSCDLSESMTPEKIASEGKQEIKVELRS